MLTNKLRPHTWNEVAGQKLNVQILKAIVKDPYNSPKSIILEGVYGSGKTSLARIMARELNNIKDRDYDLDMSPFYHEYDSTIVGNVDKIRELRDTFGSGYEDYWQVIVFDETHASSTQAQTALLKVIEDVRGKTFFIFATTHVQKVIPTIRSRSLELNFTSASQEEVVQHLESVSERLDISVPEDIKYIIALRSGGHLRDVNMLLDKYLLIGEDMFKESVKFNTALFCDFFKSVFKDDKDRVMEVLNELSKTQLRDLRRDFSGFIFQCLQESSGIDSENKEVKEFVKLAGGDLLKLVRHYYSDWMRNVFVSEIDFSAGMLSLYVFFKRERGEKSRSTGVASMRDRAVRR